jgi:NAD(P)-dependent dehydrogenase (short-subunit alcohol dehydrogenase family)
MTPHRTVLVTGAAGALAAAVVPRFEALGWGTTLFDTGDGARLRDRYPNRPVRGVDLTDAEATRRAVLAAEEEAGGLDAVVNLAGGFARVSAVDATVSDVRAEIARNALTAVTTTSAALPGMLRRGHGTIVGIAAGQAVDGGAFGAPYAAGKAALVAYLRSVDHELAPQGVRAVIVYPMGTLDTPANRAAMPDADPAGWISTETLAEAIATAATLGPRGRLRELRIHPDAASVARPEPDASRRRTSRDPP